MKSLRKITKAQIFEIIKCENDPIYFMEQYVWISHPKKGRLKFKLFDYQREMVEAIHGNRYSVLLTARQMGKTLHYNCNITYNQNQIKVGSLIKLSWKEQLVTWLENLLLQLSK